MNPELQARLKFYGLEQADTSAFHSVRSALSRYVGGALEKFYSKVKNFPELTHFFSSDGMLEHAKAAQNSHWMKVFGDGLTEDYYQRAVGVGRVHARIGLEPKWYVGGYAVILEELVTDMVTSGRLGWLPSQRRLAQDVSALIKVALLDIDIALSTYFVNAEEKVRAVVLGQMGSALTQLAEGDMTARMSGLPAEYAQVERDFNAAIEALRDTLQAVSTSVNMISSGSSEIRVGSDDLAARTEKQAASLAETAEAMRQATAMVQQTAKNAAAANSSIAKTHKEATEGGAVVKQAVSAMDAIERSSGEISKIISVIDGIAFQTNLLALNAGVEAARAGDAGKGFAVVAHEVRALAQRSAEAAQEIKNLITNSTEQVEIGVKLVGETGRMLTRIVDRVGEVSEVITDIATSAESQSSSLTQVNDAVGEMDRMTQQNAAMVEESAASAVNLANEAQTLSEQVARFQFGGNAMVVPARAPTPAPAPRKIAAAPRVTGNLALKAEEDDWSSF
ncbi:MAG: methyl-accepting chemotaxis protein [Pseudomonadota bacterium]